MRHLVTLPAFAAGLLACGSLGGDGGGADNLPNRGIVPWEPVVAGSGDDASRARPRSWAWACEPHSATSVATSHAPRHRRAPRSPLATRP